MRWEHGPLARLTQYDSLRTEWDNGVGTGNSHELFLVNSLLILFFSLSSHTMTRREYVQSSIREQ
jgi:hypothetical protein